MTAKRKQKESGGGEDDVNSLTTLELHLQDAQASLFLLDFATSDDGRNKFKALGIESEGLVIGARTGEELGGGGDDWGDDNLTDWKESENLEVCTCVYV